MGGRELKASLSKPLRAVGRGEQVRVTLRGRPVADIVPASAAADDHRLHQLVAQGRVVPPAQSHPKRAPRLTKGCSPRFRRGARRTGQGALNLYLDASALVKRYVAETDSKLVRDAMQRADGWFICRCGFVETVRAVALAAGVRATRHVKEEWATFAVVEVDQPLVEHAAKRSPSRLTPIAM